MMTTRIRNAIGLAMIGPMRCKTDARPSIPLMSLAVADITIITTISIAHTPARKQKIDCRMWIGFFLSSSRTITTLSFG